MRPLHLLATAAAVLTIAGAASAQTATDQTAMPDNAAMSTPAPAMGAATDTSASLGSPSNPIPQNSPTPASDAFHLKAGDPNVVTNGPVADTPENRAAYGQPMSHAGKATKPAGN